MCLNGVNKIFKQYDKDTKIDFEPRCLRGWLQVRFADRENVI